MTLYWQHFRFHMPQNFKLGNFTLHCCKIQKTSSVKQPWFIIPVQFLFQIFEIKPFKKIQHFLGYSAQNISLIEWLRMQHFKKWIKDYFKLKD